MATKAQVKQLGDDLILARQLGDPAKINAAKTAIMEALDRLIKGTVAKRVPPGSPYPKTQDARYKDALQGVYKDVWRALDRFEGTGATLLVYVQLTASGAAFHFLRKERAIRKYEGRSLNDPVYSDDGSECELGDVLEIEAPSTDPREDIHREQLLSALQGACRSAKEFEIIRLIYFDGLTYEETAAELKISRGRVQYATTVFRERMLGESKDPDSAAARLVELLRS